MKRLLALLPLATACGLDNQTLNEQEVITSVVLDFDGTRFEFNDPDGDGGEDPTIDPVVLAPGNYTLTVRFENRLEGVSMRSKNSAASTDVSHTVTQASPSPFGVSNST